MEVRGNIVGKGLARLANHLPQELPFNVAFSRVFRAATDVGLMEGKLLSLPKTLCSP
jgi:hypothetical protein